MFPDGHLAPAQVRKYLALIISINSYQTHENPKQFPAFQFLQTILRSDDYKTIFLD
jgi:hypothetical protein